MSVTKRKIAMSSEFVLLAMCCFAVSGCISKNQDAQSAGYRHSTYVGCSAKFGNAPLIPNMATIVDQGDSFIVQGSAGDFYSGSLVLRNDQLISSEPAGGLVFSKGVGDYSKMYLVHIIKDNKLTVFDCRSALVK
ncbi:MULTISPECIES: hypothetical protein [Klebsiella]|jgi:hypothetical protein|uniref:hypothetical protein n=1 Tax=Klebsiella TaxID=570 RepID=UPI0007DABFFC|nr:MULTISPECIES: hypothetical protein [Klebsiella]HBZ7527414.1 hypothetical protein [Klebsiella quasipneumoniae subsp. similipneumoniae]HCQ8674709.1 hypothetical protein [Klebsiella variicola]HCT4800995.1 hypothetical protein [Klebsiella michiganensis]MBZ7799030.1 hypothetical protein [Klebsiella pneumoniae]MCS4329542.1 hypothetical protein [Klebsiella pneumoniae]